MAALKQGKRIRFAIEARQVEVAKLYLQRKTQREIAEILGVHQATVYRDVKELEQEMRREASEYLWLRKQQLLADNDRVRAEAYQAYERSKQDRVRKTVEQETTPQGAPGEKPAIKVQRATQTTEGQSGDPRFLDVILKANAEEAKLLGHYEPEKKDVREVKIDLTERTPGELAQMAAELAAEIAQAEEESAKPKELPS